MTARVGTLLILVAAFSLITVSAGVSSVGVDRSANVGTATESSATVVTTGQTQSLSNQTHHNVELLTITNQHGDRLEAEVDGTYPTAISQVDESVTVGPGETAKVTATVACPDYRDDLEFEVTITAESASMGVETTETVSLMCNPSI